MKTIILLSLLSLNAFSLTFSITKPCVNEPELIETINLQTQTTVSEITLNSFEDNSIPFIGDERSINSILNTPTGLDAYEVVSDTEMKIYGWCFQVNGVQPDRFMNEIQIDPAQETHINWFYGFAHYLNDEWIAYCTPAYTAPSSFICN